MAYESDYVTSWLHGLLSTVGGGLASSFSSGVSIQTTVVRSGPRALKIPLAADNKFWRRVGGGKSFGVHPRLSAVPANDLVIAHLGQIAGTDHRAGVGINAATGKWRLFHRHSGGSIIWGSDGPDFVPDTWHFVQTREETSGIVEGYVDGTALTTLDTTSGHAGGVLGTYLLGNAIGNTDTLDMYYADLIGYGNLTRPWPIPDFQVELLGPVGEGTHVNSGSFTDDAANSPPVTPHLRVDEIPVSTTGTDFISQTTIGASDYIELLLSNPTNREAPIGIHCVGERSNGGGFNSSNISLRIVNASGSESIFAGAFISGQSFIGNGIRTGLAAAPSWSAEDVDAMVARIGFSSDVTPTPEIHAVFLEVAAPPPPAEPEGWPEAYVGMITI
jgi:hypothetical protein